MRVFFEHSGFDVPEPWGDQAFRGAETDWAKMFEQLTGVIEKERGRSSIQVE